MKSRCLRAARALIGEEQAAAAAGAGLAWNTLVAAERGKRISERTWTTMLAFYESRGVFVKEASRKLVLSVELTNG